MKQIILLSLFAFVTAHAETQLSCWDMYAKSGSHPLLTAQISTGNALQVKLNLESEFFQSYQYDESGYEGKTHQTGVLEQPAGVVKPTLNVSNHSPYKGNNEYTVRYGHTTHRIFEKVTDYELTMRLVLPTDLTNASLKNYRIRNSSERSNAVIITAPPANTNQGGDNYVRLFCVSK